MNDIKLRVARPSDAAELLALYAPYVEDTAISFETVVPSLEEFTERMVHKLPRYPYIVAEKGGELLGYAYLSPFVGRAAYLWAAETTIYLRRDCRKMGIGKMLYTALESLARAQGIINLEACIGWTDEPDEHLTNNSAEYHAHLGYRMVGRFYKCGYKFGTWYDMVWMEKLISEHPETPQDIIPFSELSAETLKKAGHGVLFSLSFGDRAAGEVHVFVERAHAVDYAVVGDLDYAVCDGLRELVVVA